MPPNPAERHVHADTTVRNEMEGKLVEWVRFRSTRSPGNTPILRMDMGTVRQPAIYLNYSWQCSSAPRGWMLFGWYIPSIAGSKLNK